MDKTQLQKWMKEELLPQKVRQLKIRRQQQAISKKLQANAPVLRQMVADVLEGRYQQAMEKWNKLGLEPQLQSIRLDAENDALLLITKDGRNMPLAIEELLEDLNQLVG